MKDPQVKMMVKLKVIFKQIVSFQLIIYFFELINLEKS